MKRHIFALGAAASLVVFSSSALASAQPSNAQLIAAIHKISQETDELRHEVKTLKAQLRHRKTTSRSRYVRRQSHVETIHSEDPHPFHRGIITVTTSPWAGLKTRFRPDDLLERQ